ncbi:MAG: hypothetical protein ACRDD8_06195 [Bacteroidales bacterium]
MRDIMEFKNMINGDIVRVEHVQKGPSHPSCHGCFLRSRCFKFREVRTAVFAEELCGPSHVFEEVKNTEYEKEDI